LQYKDNVLSTSEALLNTFDSVINQIVDFILNSYESINLQHDDNNQSNLSEHESMNQNLYMFYSLLRLI